MSGYAIAYVSALHGTPCYLVKVVSGYLFGQDTHFQRTLERAHETIGTFLIQQIGA
jgi:hypothetical protein